MEIRPHRIIKRKNQENQSWQSICWWELQKLVFNQ